MQNFKNLFCVLLVQLAMVNALQAAGPARQQKNPSKKAVIKRPDKPHIAVPQGVPGISSLFAVRPETAKPMRLLAHILLKDSDALSKDVSTLSRGERELIASYVSYLNECIFCCSCHSAAAVHLLDGDAALVEAVKKDYMTAPISEKMKALLTIAGKVQRDARSVSEEDVAHARALGATDLEIHDTVLIAAAFCMYNRYVDGLASWTPTDPNMYDTMGKVLAAQGYMREKA